MNVAFGSSCPAFLISLSVSFVGLPVFSISFFLYFFLFLLVILLALAAAVNFCFPSNTWPCLIAAANYLLLLVLFNPSLHMDDINDWLKDGTPSLKQ